MNFKNIISRILPFLTILVITYNCENRKDIWADLITSHNFYLKTQGSTVFDTISENDTLFIDSIKIGYSLQYQYTYTSTEDSIANVIWDYNDAMADITTNGKDKLFEYTALNEGYNILDFTVKNSNYTAEYFAKYYHYQNLNPVVVAKCSALEYVRRGVKIDLSASYDPDSIFDGEITMYSIQIKNVIYAIDTLSVLNHVLSEAGTYEILCQVRDNDNVWSEPDTIYFKID